MPAATKATAFGSSDASYPQPGKLATTAFSNAGPQARGPVT